MLAKKLVTLACAAGILACGACFLPPLPEGRPQPPPIQLDLHGVRHIGVQVVDSSAEHHLLPPDVASSIADRLNEQGRRDNLAAFSMAQDPEASRQHAVRNPAPDAVLLVTMLSEKATPDPAESTGESKAWNVEVVLAAVLTRANGEVLWQETDGAYRFHRTSGWESAEELWRGPVLGNGFTWAVASRLVSRMLSGQ